MEDGIGNSGDGKGRFPKLNESNYADWRPRIDQRLRGIGVGRYMGMQVRSVPQHGMIKVSGSEKESIFDIVDGKAMDEIMTYCGEQQIRDIQLATTAFEAMETLEKKYSDKSKAKRIQLVKEILVSPKTYLDVMPALDAIQSAAGKLRTFGSGVNADKFAIPEWLQVDFLLISLPEELKMIRTVCMDWRDADYTLLKVGDKIRSEIKVMQMREKHMDAVDEANFAGNRSKTIVCFSCGQLGHISRDCDGKRVEKCNSCGFNGHHSDACNNMKSKGHKAGGYGKEEGNFAWEEGSENDFPF